MDSVVTHKKCKRIICLTVILCCSHVGKWMRSTNTISEGDNLKTFLNQISIHFIQWFWRFFIFNHEEEDCQIFIIFNQSEALLSILNEVQGHHTQFLKRTIKGVSQQINAPRKDKGPREPLVNASWIYRIRDAQAELLLLSCRRTVVFGKEFAIPSWTCISSV